MAVVSKTVNLIDDSFRLVTLHPGDEIPDWAEGIITNPAVLATVPPIVVSDPEPEEKVDYAALSKVELIKLCNDRGIDSSGNKPDMQARLLAADEASAAEAEQVDVWSLSEEELLQIAAERNIDIGEATTTAELAAALEQAGV